MSFDVGSIVGRLLLNDTDWRKNLNSATKSLDKVQAKIQSGLNQIGNFSRNLAIAGAAITAVTGVLTANAAEAETSFKKLDIQARNVGIDIGKHQKQLGDFVKEITRSTIWGEEEIFDFIRGILPYTRDFEKSLEATRIAADMVAQGITDKAGAVRQVGLVYEGIYTMIGRYVPMLREEENQTLKNLKGEEKLTYALGVLRNMYGGISRIEAKTFSGIIVQIKNEIGELAEAIGVPMLPKLKEYASRIKEAVISIREWISNHEELAKTVGLTALAIGSFATIAGTSLWTITTVGGLALRSMTGLFKFIISDAGLVTASLLGIAAAAYTLRAEYKQNLYGMRDETDKVAKSMKNFGASIWEYYERVGKAAFNKVMAALDYLVTFLGKVHEQIKNMAIVTEDLLTGNIDQIAEHAAAAYEGLKHIFDSPPAGAFKMKRDYWEEIFVLPEEAEWKAKISEFFIKIRKFIEPWMLTHQHYNPLIVLSEGIKSIPDISNAVKTQFLEDMAAIKISFENMFSKGFFEGIGNRFNKFWDGIQKKIARMKDLMEFPLKTPFVKDRTMILLSENAIKTTADINRMIDSLNELRNILMTATPIDQFAISQIDDKLKELNKTLDLTASKFAKAGIDTTASLRDQIRELENLKRMAGDDVIALDQINEKIEELKDKLGGWGNAISHLLKDSITSTLDSLENSFNSFVDDAIEGNLKKASDYFRAFAKDILKQTIALCNRLFMEWAAVAIIKALAGGGGSAISKVNWGGGGDMAEGFGGSKQEGGYIRDTGIYKLHAGEDVKRASESSSQSAPQWIIQNHITPEAQARALQARAPRNTIINIISEDALLSGSTRHRIREA